LQQALFDQVAVDDIQASRIGYLFRVSGIARPSISNASRALRNFGRGMTATAGITMFDPDVYANVMRYRTGS
jgi:uncharacterized protein with PIN domain